MKIVTSATVFNDAVGVRLSATYSEVDDDTGRIISDNQRYDRVITDTTVKNYAARLIEYATDNLPIKEE
jgi:hypothetical protein